MKENLKSLIQKGGVFVDVEGKTPEEIYKKVCDSLTFPPSITKETVYNALCSREKIMSTAIGNGITLPHASSPVIKEEDQQRIVVAYLKTPLDMKAPDERLVYVMFFILTQNRQIHLEVLSSLVEVFGKIKFRKLLESKASIEEILNALDSLDDE